MRAPSPTTVQTRLDASIPNARTELHARNPYELLVAVLLSAQMTDSGVNRVTPALFRRYPTVQDLARARIADVERLVRSINYYRTKARHAVAAAKAIVRGGGAVPTTLPALRMLPGIGPKSAAVLAGEFGTPQAIAVDTHVFRVARRLGLARAKNPERVARTLERKFPRASWVRLHHQLVLHGRYVCLARAPKCGTCALRDVCPSRQDLPRNKKGLQVYPRGLSKTIDAPNTRPHGHSREGIVL